MVEAAVAPFAAEPLVQPIARLMQRLVIMILYCFFPSNPALMVGPVNMIPEMVSKRCPRVLLNRELAGTFLKRNGPSTRRMSYDSSVQRDIFHQGDCDASIRTLCGILGWANELLELNLSTRLGGRG